MSHRNFGRFPIRIEHALHESIYPLMACLIGGHSAEAGSGTQWSGEYQCISNFEVTFCQDSFRSRKAIDGHSEFNCSASAECPPIRLQSFSSSASVQPSMSSRTAACCTFSPRTAARPEPEQSGPVRPWHRYRSNCDWLRFCRTGTGRG